jgi:hypothetical protein
MDLAEMRLEALKLAVRPGLEILDIIKTAEAYFAFIGLDMPEAVETLEFPDEAERARAPRGLAARLKAAHAKAVPV